MAQQPEQPRVSVERSIHQICTPQGDPYQSYATDPIWVTKSDPYPYTDGNDIHPLLTGEAYFEELAVAISGAEQSIYMLGWQINWDVHLRPGVRLYDAMLAAAKARPALKIYVLPWEGSSFVPTYAAETIAVIKAINEELGSGAPRVFATAAAAHPNSSAGADSFFSHHQKQVVIDERIGFVGGIDVAYGRRDDASFSLDASGRHGNDSYNGCLPHLLKVKAGGYVIPADLNRHTRNPGSKVDKAAPDVARKGLRAGEVQYPADGVEINPTTQPRMPWQDVHLKIEGPAVSDLASNFVLRWNSANTTPRLALPPVASAYAKKGTCQVQLLRSASGKMVGLEAGSVTASERSRVHDKYWHNHIHHAMIGLIEKADHFIYIENQFFVSGFGHALFGDRFIGTPDKSPPINSVSGTGAAGWATRRAWGDETAPPVNLVCEALGTKLHNVIMNAGNPPPDGKTSRFHLYITLPVHPEGMLNDSSYMTQVHYTMQSLVFGSQSLINRIRRAILARKRRDKNEDHAKVFADDNREYEEIPIDDCWPYITLLNLRNWAKLGNATTGERYVTEQIYVHTKMMVVDDRYVLLGSANINDRSLLGNRDSEMAVLVMDTNNAVEDIGAFEGPQVTRKFARDLRMGVWKKLFCLSGAKANVKPASKLIAAVKRPAAQGSWEAIRGVATLNTRRYDAAFAFIPRNSSTNIEANDSVSPPVSIWPTKFSYVEDKQGADPKTYVAQAVPGGLMPFDPKFWDGPRHSASASALAESQGFITLLPWLWTRGENNNNGYHSALYVEVTPSRPASEISEEGELASLGHGDAGKGEVG